MGSRIFQMKKAELNQFQKMVHAETKTKDSSLGGGNMVQINNFQIKSHVQKLLETTTTSGAIEVSPV